jgi:hypothetical protein
MKNKYLCCRGRRAKSYFTVELLVAEEDKNIKMSLKKRK